MRPALSAPLLGLLSAVLAAATPPQTNVRAQDSDRALREVVGAYAARAHSLYATAAAKARAMQRAIDALLDEPNAAHLSAARRAWITARQAYAPTEVFRFYGGPIDDPRHGVERFVNAWPIDEAYLDGVADRPDAGMIQDPKRYPALGPTLLTVLHQSGGETRVATGWHAIEFLLWGQDRRDDGPGERPHTDFVVGAAPHSKRRSAYLQTVTALLVAHLEQVRDAWDQGGGAFAADRPDVALRQILTGMVVLSGFELSGERLAVAYETQDQEDEHSCFSDTTHQDLCGNQRGVALVWNGSDGHPGLRHYALAQAPALAREVDTAIAAAAARLQRIPTPFDQAIRGADEAPGRRAVLAAIEALEVQAMRLADLGRRLGVTVPLRPGG
ncbi:MAG: imelysin family protein [Planctomycetota bacterium]